MNNIRLFTVTYCGALLLIGSLTVGLHFFQVQIVESQKRNAEIINVAGRQRMLSQKVALHYQNYVAENDADRQVEHYRSFEEAVTVMRDSHGALTVGLFSLSPTDPSYDRLNALYYGETRLDERVKQYLADAEVAMNQTVLGTVTPDTKFLGMSAPLLTDLDVAVASYERNAASQVDHVKRVSVWCAVAIIVLLLAEAVFIFRPVGRRMYLAEEELRALALTDPLTGCHNRRGFMTAATAMIALMRRHDKSVACVIFDIDHFKRVNDTYGHATGDEVIIMVVRAALGNLRESDVLGRVGGEEFAIFLPNTDVQGARLVAEKIRKAIEITPYKDENYDFYVTASFGVSASVPTTSSCPAAFMDASDDQLYRAKRSGRNKVCTTDDNLIVVPPANAA